MLHLISCFCHRLLFSRPALNRKQITKATYCKDRSLRDGLGGVGPFREQELRDPTRNFHIVHESTEWRTYPVWFTLALLHDESPSLLTRRVLTTLRIR
jgi:hypothetical protein